MHLLKMHQAKFTHLFKNHFAFLGGNFWFLNLQNWKCTRKKNLEELETQRMYSWVCYINFYRWEYCLKILLILRRHTRQWKFPVCLPKIFKGSQYQNMLLTVNHWTQKQICGPLRNELIFLLKAFLGLWMSP